VFWGAVLALHVWPLAKVLEKLASAGAADGRLWLDVGLLVLAMAFFGAKSAGVRWLLMPACRGGPWAGAVVFLIACGIVHGDRVRPKDPATIAAAAVLSTAGAVETVVRTRWPRTGGAGGSAGRGGRDSWLSVLIAAVAGWLELGAPLGRASAGAVFGAMPRGPPATARRRAL
jgi:hypothetical protein